MEKKDDVEKHEEKAMRWRKKKMQKISELYISCIWNLRTRIP